MKSGNKNNKQNQALRQAQTQLQLKKKQCLQLSISCQSLQNKNAALLNENTRISAENIQMKEQTDALIDNLKFHISILEDRNRQLLMERREIEIKYDTLRINHQALIVEYDVFKVSRDLQTQELKNKIGQQKQIYTNAQNNFNHAINQHAKLVKELNDLKQLREKQKQVYKNKVADIERDKIQSIDIIKKQMMNKACEMRNKALEIRKEQFQTTTRLTLLQNDQLVRQLQFQSTKTENILKRNTELENEVKELKRSIEIHESVEKQIMKRNVVAKNTISALTKELKNLDGRGIVLKQSVKEALKDYAKLKGFQNLSNKSQASTNKVILSEVNSNQQIQNHFNSHKQQLQQLNEKLIFLQEYNKNVEKTNQARAQQIIILNTELESVKKQLAALKNKTGMINCDNIAGLLIRFFEEAIRPLKQKQSNCDNVNEEFDLHILKDIEIEKWSTDSVEKIVKIILNLMRPYLTMKILKLPYFQTNNPNSNLDYESLKQNLKGSKYVQALKRHRQKSLQNIKNRSVSFIVQQNEKLKNVSSHRKLSTPKNGKIQTFQPIARRFIKPHLINKV